MNSNQIKAAEPGAILWDDKVRGLHLRVFPQSRAFYVYFRIKGTNKERRPKIGEYPAYDLTSAREVASRYLRDAQQGIDPIAKRNQEANRPTVDQLCDRYMDRHGNKKKTKKEDQRNIDKFVKPKLGGKLVAEVAYNHVEDLHIALTKDNGPILANRVVSLLSKMFALAEKWEFRPRHTNPCHGLEKNPENKRKRYMTSTEAVAIAQALEHYKAKFPAAVAFIYLLIFTGARKGEIAAARWDWLDENKLHLPDSKTGAKTIRLPQQVMDILEALPKVKGGTITGIQSPRAVWELVKEKAKVSNLTLHDLRHSYASAGISAGLELARIGELLGHADTQTTKRYAHLVDEVAEASAQRVADELENMMKPKKKETV